MFKVFSDHSRRQRDFLPRRKLLRNLFQNCEREYVDVLKRKGKFADWSQSRIKKMLQNCMDRKEDVYLTAQEAVEWGFADEVFEAANGQFDWNSLRSYK